MSELTKRIRLAKHRRTGYVGSVDRDLVAEAIEGVEGVVENGVSGTFLSADTPSKTITVVDGIITGIEEPE